jgi:hypothetical protein
LVVKGVRELEIEEIKRFSSIVYKDTASIEM